MTKAILEKWIVAQKRQPPFRQISADDPRYGNL